MNILVAVYGSLRKGFGNHNYYLRDKELVGEARLPYWRMYAYCDRYPAITRSEFKEDHVSVEVYRVDAETTYALDSLEGYPGFYNRTIVDTPFGPAFIYYMEPYEVEGRHLIPNGDWSTYGRNVQSTT